jgi:YD repeat-containing protein
MTPRLLRLVGTFRFANTLSEEAGQPGYVAFNAVREAPPHAYTYNIRGFKTGSNDADAGSWIFTPDSLNELASQTDAKSQVTTFGYDLLGRMTSRTEPESTPATLWSYGTSATAHNIGRVTQVTEPDGYAEAYTYDGMGGPQMVTYTEDAANYAFTYAYNTLGSIDTVTYPVSTSGYQFVLKSVYDAYGYLNQVKDNAAGTLFWTLNSASDASLPTLEKLGNGVQIASTYSPWTNEMTGADRGFRWFHHQSSKSYLQLGSRGKPASAH